ncbi:EamA-like transporter family protein [Oryzisolibacter propanilivorax]|uniref:EamA-like transporter family protein n=1 Tax=Oryzisolibacter propanilivorax TaxID=1527607 RepID=A0A1G9PJH8_9BURK|nr:DMT family transporter [Oryzisolibacter propanilivorax]SDL98940.1 EamA-like transporter family protein [Oryzisolibacter propanilivorax]
MPPAARLEAPTSTRLPAWVAEFVLLSGLWGASFLFMRLGAVEFGPLPTAGLRVALAALLLLPLLVIRGEGPALRRHWRPALLAGVVNSALPFSLFAWAVLHIPTGLGSILNAAVPLFGALVALLWLGERITRSRWLGLGLGFVGVALLAWRAPAGGVAAQGPATLAVVACLLASTCYAVGASFVQRYLQGVPPLACATGSLVGAALALALPTAWAWPARTPSLGAWAAVAAIALLCTGLAYLLYFRLIVRAGPSRALAVTFLAPVFALAYGRIFLGEPITPWMVGCGLVIVCGTMLSTGLVLRRRP